MFLIRSPWLVADRPGEGAFWQLVEVLAALGGADHAFSGVVFVCCASLRVMSSDGWDEETEIRLRELTAPGAWPLSAESVRAVVAVYGRVRGRVSDLRDR